VLSFNGDQVLELRKDSAFFPANLQDWSLEFWFQSTSAARSTLLVSRGESSSLQVVSAAQNKLEVSFQDSSDEDVMTLGAAVTMRQWHHCGIVLS
jgi:hypothetical protein